jgi:hypothetical protein
VIGHGYFLYYGDFNVQQVPFYQMVHDAIRSGEWQWSYTTDLGSSLVGSYTFYLLGSPFFWLSMFSCSLYVRLSSIIDLFSSLPDPLSFIDLRLLCP